MKSGAASGNAAKRYVRDSLVETTELVLPNDTNQLGNLLGGRLMHWMDIAAAIAAQRHSGRVCVTASVDELNFHRPIRLGEVVILRASVIRAFGTSMEIGVTVQKADLQTGKSPTTNTAYFTFVALGESGQPISVPRIVPRTTQEKRRYREALARRRHRLKNKTRRKT